MPIEFNCPECGHQSEVTDSFASELITCERCSATVKVPQAVSRPYGSVSDAEVPMKRKPNLVLIVAVLLSLLGMALPWVSWPDDAPAELKQYVGTDVAGFQLPFVFNDKLDEARENAAANLRANHYPEGTIDQKLADIDAARSAFRSLYALFLIPVLALLALADELASYKKGQNRWWLRVVNTLSPILAYALIYVAFSHLGDLVGGDPASGSGDKGSNDGLNLIGIGFWVVGLGAFVSFISIFTSPRPEVDEGTVAST